MLLPSLGRKHDYFNVCTLHSGQNIDGIHFNPAVYKDISKNI